MSTLAKVFVIFNLVLSVVFFGVSSTLFLARYNWREAYETSKEHYETELARLSADASKLKGQLNKIAEQNAGLKGEVTSLMSESAQQKTAIAGLTTRASAAEEMATQLSEQNQAGQTTIQQQMTQIEGLKSENNNLRSEQADAVEKRNLAIQDMTRLKIDLDKSQGELGQTRIQVADLQSKLETAELQIAIAIDKGFLPGQTIQPKLDGYVAAVNEQDKLVVLELGADQGVKEGFTFAVRRGGVFIGKVQVTDVYEDLSGARILWTKEGASISVRDQVLTTYLE